MNDTNFRVHRPIVSVITPSRWNKMIKFLNQPICLVVIGSAIIAATIAATLRRPRYDIRDGIWIIDHDTGKISCVSDAPRIFKK